MRDKEFIDLAEAYEQVYQNIDELWTGRHGQTEPQYQDSRSNAGKMVSGTSRLSGAAYSSRGVVNTGPNPAGGSQRPQGQGRMTSGQRTEMQFRQADLRRSRSARGGSSSLSNVGSSGSPSGATGPYQVGGSRGYGISGIRLADEFDLFDTILEYLVAEGYADTNENALVIMANMSEEWREEIVEEMLDEGRDDKRVPPEHRANLRNARAGFQVIDPKSPAATQVRRREHKDRRGMRGNIGGEGGSSYRYDDNSDKDYPSFRVRGRGRS